MSSLTKTYLRKSMSKILRGILIMNRNNQSAAILESLKNTVQYKNAKTVAMFISMKTEVETRSFMDDCFSSGKKVLVPKIVSDCEFELVKISDSTEIDLLPKDKWGIPIPSFEDDKRLIFHPEYTPDVIIVPGVAFDTSCRRLGHGKGYYDRYFAFLHSWCLNNGYKYPSLIGVSFDEQIVEYIPCDEYDVSLDMVVTPSCIYSNRD